MTKAEILLEIENLGSGEANPRCAIGMVVPDW